MSGALSSERLFDDYVMVDWSARTAPATGRDSIWIASVAVRDDTISAATTCNPPTRAAAMRVLTELIESVCKNERRILIGVDFPLSYPAGLTTSFPSIFGRGPAWRSIWRLLAERIEDADDNANNRFDVAADLNAETGCRLFWGCPSGQVRPTLAMRDVPLEGLRERGEFVANLRRGEQMVHVRGIQSCWKLCYAASVGSQALVGIARLERLRREVDGIRIWPFETGFSASPMDLGTVVIAEIWPTLFRPVIPVDAVRDEAQVMATAMTCARADADGDLASWLAPAIADYLTASERVEGWILGVDPTGAR